MFSQQQWLDLLFRLTTIKGMIIQKIIFSSKIQPDPKVGNTSEPSDVEGEEQQGGMDDGYHYQQGMH